MSSRFLIEHALITMTLLALLGCDESGGMRPAGPGQEPGAPGDVVVSGLVPGGRAPQGDGSALIAYADDPHVINDGERLFRWYNCSGCHFNGGGGIGPALMDDQWSYGSRLDQIYASIYQGRPNGMPAWGRKLSSDQIWQLTAYVHSLSKPDISQGDKAGQQPGAPPPPPLPEHKS